MLREAGSLRSHTYYRYITFRANPAHSILTRFFPCHLSLCSATHDAQPTEGTEEGAGVFAGRARPVRDAVILFSEGGVGAWREEWMGAVVSFGAKWAAAWEHANCAAPRFVALMHEASDLRSSDALGAAVELALVGALPGGASVQSCVRRDAAVLLNGKQSRRFQLRTFIVAATAESAESALRGWRAVQPVRVESSHFSRKRIHPTASR